MLHMPKTPKGKLHALCGKNHTTRPALMSCERLWKKQHGQPRQEIPQEMPQQKPQEIPQEIPQTIPQELLLPQIPKPTYQEFHRAFMDQFPLDQQGIYRRDQAYRTYVQSYHARFYSRAPYDKVPTLEEMLAQPNNQLEFETLASKHPGCMYFPLFKQDDRQRFADFQPGSLTNPCFRQVKLIHHHHHHHHHHHQRQLRQDQSHSQSPQRPAKKPLPKRIRPSKKQVKAAKAKRQAFRERDRAEQWVKERNQYMRNIQARYQHMWEYQNGILHIRLRQLFPPLTSVALSQLHEELESNTIKQKSLDDAVELLEGHYDFKRAASRLRQFMQKIRWSHKWWHEIDSLKAMELAGQFKKQVIDGVVYLTFPEEKNPYLE